MFLSPTDITGKGSLHHLNGPFSFLDTRYPHSGNIQLRSKKGPNGRALGQGYPR